MIEVYHKDLDQSRTVIQYHAFDWPDKEVPSQENLSGLTILTEKCVSELENRKKPILVHCSAGVGRTGVFMALVMLMRQVNALDEQSGGKELSEIPHLGISVFDLVRHLREMRWGSV